MRVTIVCLAVAASIATAMPGSAVTSAIDPRFTTWSPPGPDDVRSPCPGLNTLANHGFIPHSGKGMTLPILIAGLTAGMNIGDDFTTAIGTLGLLSSKNPLSGSFDLDDLDKHNFPIEHDASLSRQDAYFGDDHSFYQPNFDMVLSYYEGQNVTTLPVAAAAKYARVMNSNQTNPTFTYGLMQFILSYGETALYMQTMSNPVTGDAPISFVQSLFEQEKLPYEQGWRPSTLPITLESLGAFVVALNLVSPDPLAEDISVTANSYMNVIDDLIGLGQSLQNTVSR